MKNRAQRRKATRRIIHKRERLLKNIGLDTSINRVQRNRLSKVDFDFKDPRDYERSKPSISEQKKLESLNYEEE